MTTFFDLPPEVRDLVWRRARFESARDRVAAAPRVRQDLACSARLGVWRLDVQFLIGNKKKMTVMSLRCRESCDVSAVFVYEYARLRTHLFVPWWRRRPSPHEVDVEAEDRVRLELLYEVDVEAHATELHLGETRARPRPVSRYRTWIQSFL